MASVMLIGEGQERDAMSVLLTINQLEKANVPKRHIEIFKCTFGDEWEININQAYQMTDYDFWKDFVYKILPPSEWKKYLENYYKSMSFLTQLVISDYGDDISITIEEADYRSIAHAFVKTYIDWQESVK